MARSASLHSAAALAWTLWTGLAAASVLEAERYGAFGSRYLPLLAVQAAVVDRLAFLFPGALVVTLGARLLRRPPGVVALAVVLPVLLLAARVLPAANAALRGIVPGGVVRGALLAVAVFLALALAVLVGRLLGRVGVVQRAAVGVSRLLEGIALFLRDRLPVRVLAHPVWSGVVFVLVLVVLLLPVIRRPVPPTEHSVVVLLVDTLRADHMGVYGYARPTTPHVDAAAANAAVFERAVSQASWTKPSVASLFTSLYPSVHLTGSGTSVRRHVEDGVVHMVPAPASALPTSGTLPRSVVTVAEVFREAGYAVGGFVANSLVERTDGYGQGFERYETMRDAEVTRRGVEWIESHGDRPYFLYLHYMAPHAPYDPPEAYDVFTQHPPTIDIHGSASKDSINFTGQKTLTDAEIGELIDQYDGEIRYADALVDQVLAAIGDPNTIVLLTADHGEAFMDHGMVWHESFQLYEELTRVPLVWWGPGVLAGRIQDAVMHIDIVPTLLSLCGLTPTREMQGRSLVPLLAGDSLEPRPVFSETRDWGDVRAVSSDGTKLIVDREARALELYDLEADPAERTNIAPRESERRARLLERADAFDADNRRQARGVAAALRELSPSQIEKLRSLGYIR